MKPKCKFNRSANFKTINFFRFIVKTKQKIGKERQLRVCMNISQIHKKALHAGKHNFSGKPTSSLPFSLLKN